jgi:hypothetical protein
MTVTITAAPSTRTGAITLTIDTDNPLLALTRADRNGTRPVRLEAGTLPFTGTRTLRDYEPALGGEVQYRASTAFGTAEVWINLGAQGPRFTLPALPLLSVGVDTVYDYSAGRSGRGTVHEVPGRPDPIITQARMGTRRGTLSIVCNDHVDLLNLENLLAQGITVMYRQTENPGQDMYFHADAVAAVPNAGAWELTVTYIELGFPAGPVIDSGDWTFADLAATGDTFAEVAETYTDFTALLFNDTGMTP